MQLLSLFCHINSPGISMHMNKNFNALLKAGSLMISFFLMDPTEPPPICSFEPMGEEGECEACHSTRQLFLSLIERWQISVAMQLRPVESIRVCSQKIQKELRFVDIPHRHSLNPCRDQNLEEDR